MTKNNQNNTENVETIDDSAEESLDLSFFMPGAVEEAETIEEPVSKRFKDKKGEVIKWRFSPISTERMDEIEKQCMKNVVRKNRVVGKEVDQQRFMSRIAIETTTYPNLKDSQLRKAYKTEDPVEVARKMLHVPGEFAEWIGIANRVNGFDDSLEDLEEEIKN